MPSPSKLDALQFDLRYAACPQAVVVTGKPENDNHNRKLLKKEKTGYWVVADGRLRAGDAIFLILPNADRKDGYPREIYGGVIKATTKTRHDGRLIIEVRSFELEATIQENIKDFLGGMTPPQGNRANEVWAFNSDSSSRLDRSIAAAVKRSASDTVEARRARLADAKKLPPKVVATTTVFVRNADVVAEVLYLAQGECHACRAKAPFLRRDDGSPYLEVHHIKPLAEGGEDTVSNAVALCPNCHRKAHYGTSAQKNDRGQMTGVRSRTVAL